jgi:crotonobetainyl-CoA:carnitine CoA-transferase CaiB-like acyl-CoA transferase
MSDWPGVDHNGIAASGWMWEDAGVDNPPLYHPWGWADHLCALSSALATMLAVHHQRRTGEATSVTASLLGASMNATDRVLLADGSVSDAPIVDHQRKGTTPGHRLHRCADAWLAVAADRNGSVDALLAVAGVASVEDLDGAFAERDAAQVREALRAAGVPAEVVREDQRLPFLDDPENQRLRLAVTSPHQTWGALETPGVYYDFGDLDVRIDLAPPGLGEHSVEVLGELGYGEEQIVRWVDAGVVTDGR